MKKNKGVYKYFFSSWKNIIVLAVIVLFWSCSDKCKDTYCDNGICIKGDCFCDNGYSGDQCDIKESDKFVGFYYGKLKFKDSPEEQTIELKANSVNENPFDIKLNISNNNGVEIFNLKGHVDKDSLFIERSFIEVITPFDTTIELIYVSKGILKQDSILDFPVKYKEVGRKEIYEVQLHAVKK